MINTKEEWTTIIKSKNRIFEVGYLKELAHYWDLAMLLVRRDFVAYYKQTLLGPLWYIIQPLLSTLVFTIIFGNIANIPTDGVPQPLFYMSGILFWNYFSECLSKNSTTFTTNANIFGKVYFPRLTVPISVVLSNLIKFVIQLALFIGFYVYYVIIGSKITPNWTLFLFPLLILETAVLSLGVGVVISSLTTKYRDLTFLVSFGIQLWMYATPIVYPLSQIPEKWRFAFILNPMSSIVETFRYGAIGSGELNWFYLGVGAAVTLGIFIVGVLMFEKVEKTFMDRV